jgi:hypothetical protein
VTNGYVEKGSQYRWQRSAGPENPKEGPPSDRISSGPGEAQAQKEGQITMSTSNADHYARRAKNSSDSEEAIEYLVKAIHELVTAIRNIEARVSRIK